MKVNFEQDDNLPDNEIIITVKANHLSNQSINTIHKLEQLNNEHIKLIPLHLNDHVQMIKLTQIIAIEVYNNQLVYHTTKNKYTTTGQLKTILKRISNPQFIQISRSAAININQLQSLETGFSGNMTAFLNNDVKLNVSRKYLNNLKNKLRM